jgi:hypothetical protein
MTMEEKTDKKLVDICKRLVGRDVLVHIAAGDWSFDFKWD